MPRILHLRTVTGRGGGPEKTLLNSQRFIASGYELRLAYIRPADDADYDMPERAAALGAPLVDIPERGAIDPRTVWRLVREIREFRPHVLHPHDYKTNILAVLLGGWFRVPVVTTMHGYVTLGGRLDWYYRLDRWALHRMRHVIAVSDDLAAAIADLKLPAERVTVIENGIDAEHFRPRAPRDEAKKKFGIPAERLVLGCVGRLFPEKGFDLLIEAVRRLVDRGYDAHLLVAGEGPERQRLAQRVAELQLGDRVGLVGHLAETIPFYEALDVFVLSSLREGLPNVLLEAMSMRLPVVATEVGGVPRLVRNGENGFLVKSPAPDELAAATMLLLDDAALRERFGAAGRECVETRYSFRTRMARVQAVYDRVLGGASQEMGARSSGPTREAV